MVSSSALIAFWRTMSLSVTAITPILPKIRGLICASGGFTSHLAIVAVNAGDLAILVHVPGRATERVREIALVLDAIGAELWVIGRPVEGLARATVFALPETPELLSPLLAVVPVQLLAYQMAVVKGVNPDTFRRDDPRYAAAFGLLKL